jgi:hypothetical protein
MEARPITEHGRRVPLLRPPLAHLLGITPAPPHEHEHEHEHEHQDHEHEAPQLADHTPAHNANRGLPNPPDK